jgi:two-component system sensor histidine kinase KdpD
MSERGRHKVFLGMAPGVGKTFQMLEEGREEQGRGRDVVIGFLEPHGRADTAAQAEGLPIVPRRQVEYGGTSLEEMNLPAILERRPQLCLVDELAHANAPGCEHRVRYEDVDELLAAGIDVYSTVNVQHVASLAGQVAALIGVRPQETLPDRVLEDAQDVVLVDITPELLIERLTAGKIYPPESGEVARNSFFRPENLETLREVSLLQTVREIAPHVQPARVELAPRAPKSPQRILALVTPDPALRPTVYHAYRAARRLDADFDVLWVRTDRERGPGVLDDELPALERLVSTLGGTLIVRSGRDLVASAGQVAAERGATHVVIGRPRRRTRLGLLSHQRLPLQLMRVLPDADIQIVALPGPTGPRRR